MSKEKLTAFAEAVSKSEELQKRLVSIQVETARLTAEKMAKLSESAGTPFTAEEYLQSVADLSDEMSAEQLRTVAGGAVGWETFGDILISIANPLQCGLAMTASFLRSPEGCSIT